MAGLKSGYNKGITAQSLYDSGKIRPWIKQRLRYFLNRCFGFLDRVLDFGPDVIDHMLKRFDPDSSNKDRSVLKL